ncbi:MAG: hypothetical protein ACRCR4_12685, partial [Thiotrichaceae bacterium]
TGKIVEVMPLNTTDPSELVDFEVLDVLVRTGLTVANSKIRVMAGTFGVSDIIISQSAALITRAASIDRLYNKFYPLSNPEAYKARPCLLVDSGGATAAPRNVTLFCRRLG